MMNRIMVSDLVLGTTLACFVGGPVFDACNGCFANRPAASQLSSFVLAHVPALAAEIRLVNFNRSVERILPCFG